MIHQFAKYAASMAMVAMAMAAPPAVARQPDHPPHIRPNEKIQQLAALQGADRRLLDVSFRLQSSAGDLCSGEERSTGMVLHDRLQYADAYQAAAETLFGFGAVPNVLAVAVGGPAAKAGVLVGDGVAAVNGVAVPSDGGLQRVESVEAAIDAAAEQGPVTLEVLRGAQRLAVAVDPIVVCATRFRTVATDQLVGRADGRIVEISTGLIAVAQSPDELAAIVAHELAHDILGHAARLSNAGVSLARRHQDPHAAALIRTTEIEADSLSVYLMDRAGYDPGAAITLWRRITARPGSHDVESSTHGSDSDRITRLTAEIGRLNAMKASGLEPRPAFMVTGPSQPR